MGAVILWSQLSKGNLKRDSKIGPEASIERVFLFRVLARLLTEKIIDPLKVKMHRSICSYG